MVEYADKISSYVSGMDYEIFSKSSLVVEACVFDLSQIGELANRLNGDCKKEIWIISYVKLLNFHDK